MSTYRSRVMVDGVVVAILPTWSDGALVLEAARRAERADIVIQDGQWHGVVPGMQEALAPEITHSSYREVVAALHLAPDDVPTI